MYHTIFSNVKSRSITRSSTMPKAGGHVQQMELSCLCTEQPIHSSPKNEPVLYIAGSTNLAALVSLPKRRDLIITILSWQARVILNATAVPDLRIRWKLDETVYSPLPFNLILYIWPCSKNWCARTKTRPAQRSQQKMMARKRLDKWRNFNQNGTAEGPKQRWHLELKPSNQDVDNTTEPH